MSEDLILVPRRYVASACHALANGKNADNTVAGLREYSLGKSVEADAQSQIAALRQELATMTADRDAEKGMKATARMQRDDLQQRLADAGRRNAVYAELLNGWLAQFPKPGVTGGPITTLKGKTLAALNHKPEASSHD